MPDQPRTRAIRYETIVATLVGISALFVSGYTAYVQRQQVRAMVWPILEYDTSNQPTIHLTLSNKGVGPAIIRHALIKIDDQPVRTWSQALEKLVGPGPHRFSESSINGHVLSAGESIEILTPHDPDGNPLTADRSGPLWSSLNSGRQRVSVEICYCSTLGECWTLRSDTNGSSTMETKTCPGPSTTSFQQ